MTDLSDVKVGDKLCVEQRLGGKQIVLAEKITPSGRVITKVGTFTSDGRLYGSAQDGWNRTYARPATEDDISGIYRLGMIHKIERCRVWEKMTPDDLKTVFTLVEKYSK